jgi:hypothetical protein
LVEGGAGVCAITGSAIDAAKSEALVNLNMDFSSDRFLAFAPGAALTIAQAIGFIFSSPLRNIPVRVR